MEKNINFTWKDFEKGCQFLANKITKDGLKFNSIYGVPRGGLVIATKLSHLLNLNLYMQDPLTILNDEPILIVDDISDTGRRLKSYKRKGHKIATLHKRLNTKTEPDYYYILLSDTRWVDYPWEAK